MQIIPKILFKLAKTETYFKELKLENIDMTNEVMSCIVACVELY